MLHVGSRSDPSLKNLVLIVVVVLVAAFYLMTSLGTGDWLWFNPNFSEVPQAIVVHCYGEDVDINPGSPYFNTLTEIVNESLSGKKRWDPLSMSEATYVDYQTDPRMKTIELIYGRAIRVHSNYKYFSNVTNLIIPLEGRHAGTNAVFGKSYENPAPGSLHIESTEQIVTYLENQDICPASYSSQ